MLGTVYGEEYISQALDLTKKNCEKVDKIIHQDRRLSISAITK